MDTAETTRHPLPPDSQEGEGLKIRSGKKSPDTADTEGEGRKYTSAEVSQILTSVDVLTEAQQEVPQKIKALLSNVGGLGGTEEDEKIIPKERIYEMAKGLGYSQELVDRMLRAKFPSPQEKKKALEELEAKPSDKLLIQRKRRFIAKFKESILQALYEHYPTDQFEGKVVDHYPGGSVRIGLEFKRIKREEVIKNFVLFKTKAKKETKDTILEISFGQERGGADYHNELGINVLVTDNTFLPGYSEQLTQLLRSKEVTSHNVQYLSEPEE